MEVFSSAAVYKKILAKVLPEVMQAQMEMLNVQYTEVDPAIAKNIAHDSENLADLSDDELDALAGKDRQGTDPNSKLYAIKHLPDDTEEKRGEALSLAQKNYEIEQRKWENIIQQQQRYVQTSSQTLSSHAQALDIYTQLGKALTDIYAYAAQNQIRG